MSNINCFFIIEAFDIGVAFRIPKTQEKFDNILFTIFRDLNLNKEEFQLCVQFALDDPKFAVYHFNVQPCGIANRNSYQYLVEYFMPFIENVDDEYHKEIWNSHKSLIKNILKENRTVFEKTEVIFFS